MKYLKEPQLRSKPIKPTQPPSIVKQSVVLDSYDNRACYYPGYEEFEDDYYCNTEYKDYDKARILNFSNTLAKLKEVEVKLNDLYVNVTFDEDRLITSICYDVDIPNPNIDDLMRIYDRNMQVYLKNGKKKKSSMMSECLNLSKKK